MIGGSRNGETVMQDFMASTLSEVGNHWKVLTDLA